MSKAMFNQMSALAKYRVSMKRKLRSIGCQFDNEIPTEHLEFLMRTNNLEV